MAVECVEIVSVEVSSALELEVAVVESSALVDDAKEVGGTEEICVFSELVEVAVDVVEEVYAMEDVTVPDRVVETSKEVPVRVF